MRYHQRWLFIYSSLLPITIHVFFLDILPSPICQNSSRVISSRIGLTRPRRQFSWAIPPYPRRFVESPAVVVRSWTRFARDSNREGQRLEIRLQTLSGDQHTQGTSNVAEKCPCRIIRTLSPLENRDHEYAALQYDTLDRIGHQCLPFDLEICNILCYLEA